VRQVKAGRQATTLCNQSQEKSKQKKRQQAAKTQVVKQLPLLKHFFRCSLSAAFILPFFSAMDDTREMISLMDSR